MAAPSKARVFGRSLAGSNPAVGMAVSCECFVLSDKGLRDRPILRSGESHPVCVCVCVCVSLNVVWRNNNPLHLQRVGTRGQTKKETKKERKRERKKESGIC